MNVTQILERAVRYFPNNTAYVAGDQKRTYSEFQEQVNRLGNALVENGVGKGDRVAVLSANSGPYLEMYYATSAIGSLIVPLNHRLAPVELAYILQDSGSKLVLLGEGFEEAYAEVGTHLETKPPTLYSGSGETPQGMADYDESLANASPDLAAPDVDEQDLAGLFYTSGTTGNPKGVMLTHRNCVSNALHFMGAVKEKEGEVYLHCCPMFHLADGPTSHRITWLGGNHVIVPGFDPIPVLDAIQTHRVSSSLMVPTMINFLVNHPRVGEYDLSSIRWILYGGAPMPVELLREASRVLRCNLIQLYGLTETAPLLTMLNPEHVAFEGDETKVRRLASCGRAVAGVDVRVTLEDGKEVKPGEIGEIVCRGPNIMKGYWNKPEETSDAFRGSWFRTGDLATIDDEQFIFIVDRKKDMIITGGENVFSTEVEQALYKHPAVLEAAVIGVPAEKWGETVMALVVTKPGESATETDIIEHCRSLIAHFKCPRGVEIRSEPFPKSGSGKILKGVLREPFWEGKDRRVN